LLKQRIQSEWLLIGVFNLIYRAEDKNNSRLNRRLMGKFKSVLDELEVKELPLHRRRFTWSSYQSMQPSSSSSWATTSSASANTMTRIDRMFCSTSWEEIFPTAHMHDWASTVSDHNPLILQGETGNAKYNGFRFESYWLGLPDFLEVVKQAWIKPLQATNAVRRLHIKLSQTAKALKSWERNCVGNIKTQLAVVKEVFWLLDQAQERRAISQEEIEFKAMLKEIYFGLLTVDKIRARQRSRLMNIKYGDVCTKLFFLRANGQKRKKHIQILQTRDGLAIKHEDKAKEIDRHFDEVLGTKTNKIGLLELE
jgi:hypothetical protein